VHRVVLVIIDSYLLVIFLKELKEECMKIAKMFGLVLLITLAFGAFQLSLADEKGGPAPSDDQGWFCPWAGQGNYGMGPGMMGRGYGGMMGQGYNGMMGYGPGGMMGYGPGYGYHNYNRSGHPITIEQAKVLVEHYLTTVGNPNLKSGKITDNDKFYEAEIVTKDGSLVDKLMIDKQTGWMKSVY
jgi:hypothetical protein